MRAQRVAIIGMACRFPGAADTPEKVWRLLIDGLNVIDNSPEDRWDLEAIFHPDKDRPGKLYTQRGGYLKGIDMFDADFFGISPREASRMDPQQRILLELAWEALEAAGQPLERVAGSETAVFIGLSGTDYAHIQYDDIKAVNAYTNVGAAASIAANRLSHFFDLHGPSVVVDTACSSSLVALHQACQSIRSGESKMALAGGINLILRSQPSVGFCKASMLSPRNQCSSFDAAADGYVRAEGGGIFVLKPLEQAEADGDPIHGVIRGSGVNSDGHTSGIFLPSAEAQAELLRKVYKGAGIAPSDVSYVEAHGTGTPAGDPIECKAIGSALGTGRQSGNPCLVGSIKSNIGHLEPAAGVAGLMKILLAMKHHVVPANYSLRNLNPNIPFDELNLKAVRENTPLPSNGKPLVMGVNSFGFGGTNAHLVVEEYRAKEPARFAPEGSRSAPLLVSANDENALKEVARGFADLLGSVDAPDYHDVCFSAAMRRTHLAQRLALYADGPADAAARLIAFASGDVPERAFQNKALGHPAKMAMVFCGNGPQWWAMGQQLLAADPIFRRTVETIDSLFMPLAGWSLIEELESDESASRLKKTEYAQPALFAVQIGLFELLKTKGLSPDTVLGHSVGEVAAAFASGALSLEQAVRVIFERSRWQGLTAGMGKMAALGLPPEEAESLVARFDGRVVIAGVNSPNAVTLSGDEDDLKSLVPTMEQRGVFYRVLDLDYAFHSDAMRPVRNPLLKALRGLKPQKTHTRLISTVTGEEIDGRKLGPSYWWDNVRDPVLFGAAVQTLLADGYAIFLEIGPHPVLATYIGECINAADAGAKAVATLRRDQPEAASIERAVADCHTLGAALNLSCLFPVAGNHVALPTYRWQRERQWHEGPRNPAEHPLLGVREKAADFVWSRELDSAKNDYLRDHVVQGAAIFPAAGYLEMALFAASRVEEAGSYDLEEVEIRKALVLPEGATPFVQLSVSPETHSFQINSRPDRLEGAWTNNVVGRLGAASSKAAPKPMDIAGIRERMTGRVSKSQLYDAARRCGLQYGKLFQGVQEIEVGRNEVLGKVALPRALAPGRDEYLLHPSLLDACFQAVLGVMLGTEGEEQTETFLPVQIRRLRFYRNGKSVAYCHARITRRGARSMLADLRLLSAKGEVVAEIEGFRFQRVDLTGQAADTPMYEFKPELRLRDRLARASLSQTPESMAALSERIASRVPKLISDAHLDRFFSEMIPGYYKLCGYYAARALEGLGAREAPFTIESLMLPRDERSSSKHRATNGNGHAANGKAHINGASHANGKSNGHSVTASQASAAFRARKTATVRSYLEQTLSPSVLSAWPRNEADQIKVDQKTLQGFADDPAVAKLLKEPEGTVLPLYKTMLSYLVEMAEEDGFLTRKGNGWAFKVDTVIPDPNKLWREMVAEFPAALPELLLLGRCGDHLVEILTGALDPLQIVNLTPLEHLYESGPNFALYNRLLSEAAQQLAKQLPEGRALRVLEIGAGTGAATSFIAPYLPSDRTEYTFTDVSEIFLASAEVKFADFPFMRYRVLDIERDPAEQGFDLHGYDLVIAANVLHATKDLKTTLARARSMVAADGVLLLHETHRYRVVDMVFGLIKDWWAFRDTDLRPNAPVLAPKTWRAVLADIGFADVNVFNESELVRRDPLQSVIIARNPAHFAKDAALRDGEEQARTWLLLTDGEATPEQSLDLGTALKAAGQHVITVTSAGSYAEIDAQAYSVDPTSRAQMDQLCQALSAAGTRIDEIVHLWGFGATTPESADALLALQDKRCMSTAYLTQALQSAGWRDSPRLWLLTSGALAHPGLGGPVNPAQAPLWGLGRVIQNEQPALSCQMLDVYAGDAPEDVLPRILDELLRPTNEDEVLLSSGMRHVNVIRRTSLVDQQKRSHAGSANGSVESGFRLDFLSQGSLENLMLRPVPVLAPGRGQVLLQVRAAGLNFRDVMWAMGMLPEEALENGFSGPTLGMECSGTVVAVGEGVEGVAAGDNVVAFASSCFGKYVLADAVGVAPMPAKLTYSEAATIPTVFFTAYYALKTLAGLQPGEKLLIHGAAGGVGLAAIQIAKHLGAEIFATAGTPEKRDFVRYLGADHVLDSRSLEFADRIVETTGGGVDVVLNSLSGQAIYRNLRLLNPFGRFLEIGKRDLYANSKIGLKPFCNNISYFAIDADQFLIEKRHFAGKLFKEVMELVEAGVLRPLVHRAFPVSRVVDAFRHMQQSKHIGKIVVTMDDPRLSITPDVAERCAFRSDGTYLISGGLGGFGLATARWMVERGAGNLVLLGRRGAATAEARKAVAQLRKAGAKVVVAKADVGREADLKRVLKTQMAGLPPLRGVLHAAMVLDDHIVMQSDRERFMSALRPKIAGAWNLHHLTEDIPLEFFIVYSSATTLIGNPGQANYVAANLYLESLVSMRRRQGLPGLCIAWGGIEDVGYLARHAELRGQMEERISLQTLTSAEAISGMERLLLAGAEQVAIAGFNWPKTLSVLPSGKSPKFDVMRSQGTAEGSGATDTGEVLALLADLPEDERAEVVTQLLAEQVAKVLRTSVAKVDVAKSLLDMGIDSLMGVEMKMLIDKQFGVDLPAMEVMGGASIAQIAKRILTLTALPAAAQPSKSHKEGEQLKAIFEEIDKEVDELSDEAIDAYMAQLSGDFHRPAGAGRQVSKMSYDMTGLTPTQKRAAVKQLLRQRAAEAAKSIAAPLTLRKANGRSKGTDSFFRFEEDSDYGAARTMMDLAKSVGIPNPYYRDHDGNARAVTSIGGKQKITFANYNYLGLSGHPTVSQAAKDAIDRYGTSVSASRIVSGQRPLHRELEAEIAGCLDVADCIVFIAGFTTNVTTIGHLLGPKDLILHDALSHNSLIQGAILSGARRMSFPHSDWPALDKILRDVREDFANVLVVVEGMYSMDGDFPDVRPLIEIKKRHRALLMIDEAHSMGVLGDRGFGIGEHFALDRNDVDIWMGTLSKSFASCGGYIAGRRDLVEYLRYTAPGAIYSVGLTPPDTAAALASFRILKSEPERLTRLRSNAQLFLDLARRQRLDTGLSMGVNIVPVIIGSSALSVVLSNALLDHGINVQPIIHPAVAEKAARLRFFISSEHTEEQVRFAVDTTATELRRLRR